MKAIILAVAAVLLAAALLYSQQAPVSTINRLQVERIYIDALGAFDPKIPAYRSWPFRFANKLHIRTHDSFIRRELLVKEGDLIDQDMLAESERDLRKYKFLEDVRITSKLVSMDKVDLYVHTEDQWTTQVDLSAGHSAGFSTFRFSLEESNFLGFGKAMRLGYKRDPERTTYDVLYFDPQFLNSRWNFEVGYQTASDGNTYTSDIIRPFYSLDTKWAYGATWDSGSFTNKLHYKGETVAEIDTNHRNGIFFAARSWGERYNKRKFGFLFSLDNLLYPNPARIIFPEAAKVQQIRKNLHPLDREDYQYGFIFKWDRQNFIEKRYLDYFGRVEDLPVGLAFASTFTRSEDVSPNPDFYHLQTIAQYNMQLGPGQYVSLYSEFGLRRDTDGHFSNLIFSSYGHYYLQMNKFHVGPMVFPRQTLATSLSTVLTKNVDAPFQISLGENEGLRGYTFKSFTGENKLLLNIEDRIFTPINYRLFAIGLAGFLDAGYVWSGEEHLQFNDFPVSMGIGLRIGLKKAQSARVVRVDFAVPLHRETSPFTESVSKGYSISISSGQIFTILGDVPKLFQLF